MSFIKQDDLDNYLASLEDEHPKQLAQPTVKKTNDVYFFIVLRTYVW